MADGTNTQGKGKRLTVAEVAAAQREQGERIEKLMHVVGNIAEHLTGGSDSQPEPTKSARKRAQPQGDHWRANVLAAAKAPNGKGKPSPFSGDVRILRGDAERATVYQREESESGAVRYRLASVTNAKSRGPSRTVYEDDILALAEALSE